MKNILSVILVAIHTALSAQTSVYHHFPDSNAVWNYNYSLYCITGSADENFSVSFCGDTAIGSEMYHKLAVPAVESYSVGVCGSVSIGYKGAIRQDTAQRKVFWVEPSSTTEQLLYDFNWRVGDTISGVLESYDGWPDIVQSIDSVLIDDGFRKRWTINSNYNISIIEGIGSTYGLFEPSPGSIVDFPDYSLSCFQQNEQTLFPDSTTACELITNESPVEKEQARFHVFPNPSRGSLSVCCDSKRIREVKISDLTGKIILDEQAGNQKTATIFNIPAGVYLLTIIDIEGTTTYEVIVSCPE
ncbi:MAG: T9SS type A sorting domain-containing protein [Bacteroidetes bacterium]|nr:T9SS type A sorting domain-containing protein [Bacteroidota bacterium]